MIGSAGASLGTRGQEGLAADFADAGVLLQRLPRRRFSRLTLMLLVALHLVEVAARAVEHRIVVFIAFRWLWPVIAIDVGGLFAEVPLDLAQDRCGLALEGLDCRDDGFAFGFQLGDGLGVVLVHSSGHVIEI